MSALSRKGWYFWKCSQKIAWENSWRSVTEKGLCVIEDCPFRGRCDVTLTVTGKNETKSTCAAHIFLLDVWVIITCDVYCANLKAKLQFVFILILNNWTLPVWLSVNRKFWLTWNKPVQQLIWRVQLLKWITIPDNRLFSLNKQNFKTCNSSKTLTDSSLMKKGYITQIVQKVWVSDNTPQFSLSFDYL